MVDAARSSSNEIRRQRSVTLKGIAIAFPLAAALWLAVYFLLQPLAGMDGVLDRLILAVKCCCVAILFCFATGIEAVAHERLVSPAIDPLSGYETRRLRVNLRYLQHTLEQLALFVPGLLGLAIYCTDGASMRAVLATAVVWVVCRAAFWIGYHFGSLQRSFGAPGMAQSLLVLLYVCARIGFDVAGTIGAVAVLAAFGAIEAVLFRATRQAPAQPNVSS